ncbi:MAG: UPF0280 family protein [Pseudomonadota bacterium]
MRMTIEAYDGSRPRTDLCVNAAKFAIETLSEIAAVREQLKAPHAKSSIPRRYSVPLRMWESAHAVGDSDLTPMAAVAGAIADSTANFLKEFKVSRIVVNNGGDIAVRLTEGEYIKVGIRSDVNSQRIERLIHVSWSSGIGGICTSGLGGRSFTRGVASAVTVAARSAAIADVAATSIANSTFIPHETIIRRPAELMDPDTDLVGLDVTCEVGNLQEEFVARCLQKSLIKADALAEQNIIAGAAITIKGKTAFTEKLKPFVSKVDSQIHDILNCHI